MEIKIECDCGTRYKFEVEPVNGRMPAEAKCPSCGADGTEAANSILEILPLDSTDAPPRTGTPAPDESTPPLAP